MFNFKKWIFLGFLLVCAILVFADGLVGTPNVVLNCTSRANSSDDNLTAWVYAGGENATHYIFSWENNRSSSLVLNMPLEVEVFDYSGNDNDGILVNSPVFYATGGPDGFGAYEFNGVNNRIYVPSTDALNSPANTQEITVSSWVLINSTKDYMSIVMKANSSATVSATNFFLGFNTGGTPRFFGGTDTIGTGGLELLTWYHVVGKCNATFHELYVNGKLNKSINSGCNLRTSSVSNLSIGIRTNNVGAVSFPLNGSVADVMVWNRSLSVREIEDLYVFGYNRTISEITLPNDKWTVKVWGVNASGYNGTYAERSLVVNNLPSIDSGELVLNVSVGNPDEGLWYDSGNLTFWNASAIKDSDGDSTKFKIVWYKNTVEQSAWENMSLITAGNTSRGDNYYVDVYPYDGKEYGVTITPTDVDIYSADNQWVCDNWDYCEYLNITDALVNEDGLGKTIILFNRTNIVGATASYNIAPTELTVPAINISVSDSLLDCNDSRIYGDGNNGYGIYGFEISNVTVRNCSVDSFRIGVVFEGSSNVTINWVNSSRNNINAIAFSTSDTPMYCDHVYIYNSMFKSSRVNLGSLFYVWNSEIKNNSFIDNSDSLIGFGLGLNGQTATLFNVTVSENFFNNNSNHIFALGLANSTISNNVFYNHTNSNIIGTGVNFGMLMANCSKCNSVIKNNLFDDYYGGDLVFADFSGTYTDTTNVTVFNNTFLNIPYYNASVVWYDAGHENISFFYNNFYSSRNESAVSNGFNVNNKFCVNISGKEVGNFYHWNVSNESFGLGDCGPLNATYPLNDFLAFDRYVNDSLVFTWKNQSSNVNLTYYINFSGTDLKGVNSSVFNAFTFNLSGKPREVYVFEFTPFDGSVNGTKRWVTLNVTVDNEHVCSDANVCEYLNVSSALKRENNTNSVVSLFNKSASFVVDGSYVFENVSLNFSKANMSLNCNFSSIVGSGLFGINIWSENNTLKNCKLYNWSVGLNVYSNFNNITNNTFDFLGSYSVNVGHNSSVFWLNNFYNKSVNNSGNNNLFCLNSLGNFYKHDLMPLSGDCGPVNTSVPVIGGIYDDYINVSWHAQSSSNPITYVLEYYLDTWYPLKVTDNLSFVWDTTLLPEFSGYRLRITPYDSLYNATVNVTSSFVIHHGQSESPSAGGGTGVGGEGCSGGYYLSGGSCVLIPVYCDDGSLAVNGTCPPSGGLISGLSLIKSLGLTVEKLKNLGSLISPKFPNIIWVFLGLSTIFVIAGYRLLLRVTERAVLRNKRREDEKNNN